jgi:hypothetical protein
VTRLSDIQVAAMLLAHVAIRPFSDDDAEHCGECGLPWPCDAIRLLDERSALVAEVGRLREELDTEKAVSEHYRDKLDWEVGG